MIPQQHRHRIGAVVNVSQIRCNHGCPHVLHEDTLILIRSGGSEICSTRPSPASVVSASNRPCPRISGLSWCPSPQPSTVSSQPVRGKQYGYLPNQYLW